MEATQEQVQNGPVWAARLFVLCLLIPFNVPVGPVLLIPHRVVLLVLFIPFFLRLFVLRRAGPVIFSDWLLFGSALWAGLALIVNHPIASAIEPAGVHMLEFFGAYLLARVSIRSGTDFRKVIWTLFLVVAFLLPFAAAESITGRAVLLDLIPGNSIRAVDAGDRLGLRRAQTVFVHPILFGVFVSTGLGLFWYALRPRGLRFIAAPMVAAATIFSLSTGALMSFLVQSGFIVWETALKKMKRRWTLFASMAVVSYVVIDLLSNRTPFHVLVTYATFSVTSSYNRILIWRHGTDNIWENPIFGLGLNDWVRPSWMGSSVDNYWLLLGMQFGLPAIIMILLAVALILNKVARAQVSDPDDKLFRAGYLVAFGGLCIAGGTVHYWHAMMAFVMFIYGSGLWLATGGARRPDDGADLSDEPLLRVSRYTRQPAVGVPISASGTPSAHASHLAKMSDSAAPVRKLQRAALRIRRRP